jgi:hypothetical protein
MFQPLLASFIFFVVMAGCTQNNHVVSVFRPVPHVVMIFVAPAIPFVTAQGAMQVVRVWAPRIPHVEIYQVSRMPLVATRGSA